MTVESEVASQKKIPSNLRLNFRRNPIRALNDMAKRYGDVSCLNLGVTKFYLLTNPAHMQRVLDVDHRAYVKGPALQKWKRMLGQGLLSSEGELHHRERRLVMPAFHRARIEGYADVVRDYTEKFLSKWRDGETIDIHREMANMTLSVIAKCLFGTDVGSELDPVGSAMAQAIDYYDRLGGPTGGLIGRLPLPESKRYEAAERRLISIVYRIIKERRESGRDEGDMLSMLLNAEKVGEGVMTDQQVKDETITFLLVGHETTAVLLTWTWYLLSMNPGAEAKLHEEVDRVLADGRAATYADIPNLPYTNKTLTESMRVFPPIWAIGRRPIRDHNLGGFLLPAGSHLLMSQIVTHHDPRFYDSPEAFYPGRWTPEFRAKLPKYAYFPFGGGPRTCIGEPFAWMEGTIMLASIARGWKLVHDPTHSVVLAPKITLRPKYGMRMKLVRRDHAEGRPSPS
jgi:cytochrome P450